MGNRASDPLDTDVAPLVSRTGESASRIRCLLHYIQEEGTFYMLHQILHALSLIWAPPQLGKRIFAHYDLKRHYFLPAEVVICGLCQIERDPVERVRAFFSMLCTDQKSRVIRFEDVRAYYQQLGTIFAHTTHTFDHKRMASALWYDLLGFDEKTTVPPDECARIYIQRNGNVCIHSMGFPG